MQCLALPGESYSSLRYILDFREHVTREYLSYLDNPRGPAKPYQCTICFSVCLSVCQVLSQPPEHSLGEATPLFANRSQGSGERE